MLIKRCLIIYFCLMGQVLASGFSSSLNSSFGIVNVTVNETESAIESTDADVSVEDSEPAATSAAVTAFELNYEFLPSQKRSYFTKAIVPLTAGDGSALFLGGVGINFYLNPMASVYNMKENGNEITIMPKFRYYWGASTGVGYLVYNTESAKKSDVLFDLSLHGGGIYNFGEKWGARAEASFGRGTGAATNTTAIKIFFGASYYL